VCQINGRNKQRCRPIVVCSSRYTRVSFHCLCQFRSCGSFLDFKCRTTAVSRYTYIYIHIYIYIYISISEISVQPLSIVRASLNSLCQRECRTPSDHVSAVAAIYKSSSGSSLSPGFLLLRLQVWADITGYAADASGITTGVYWYGCVPCHSHEVSSAPWSLELCLSSEEAPPVTLAHFELKVDFQ